MREARLRWFVHVQRRSINAIMRKSDNALQREETKENMYRNS